MPAGVDDEGREIRVLRDDPVLPEGQCYASEWSSWVVYASFGVAICLGLPILALYLSARHILFGAHGDIDGRERITLLVSSYKDKYWYAESLLLVHRFVFTGMIHLIGPRSRLQLWAGTGLCMLVSMVFMLTLPYRHTICDWVQASAFFQLLLTYLSSFLFFDDGGALVDDYFLGVVLVGVNCGCFVVIVVGVGVSIQRARRIDSTRRLRYANGKGIATPHPLAPPLEYHCFLSHVWGTGQDQVRIMKQRLADALPGLQMFLDVDEPNLEIGDLEGYIDRSAVILVLATRGYFDSRNCMRELRRAAEAQKQIVCIVEPEEAKGGLSLTEIREKLKAEVQLCEALLEHRPIEWNRIGVFQNVTIRLIAERLLSPSARELKEDDEHTTTKSVHGNSDYSQGGEQQRRFLPSVSHPVCQATTFNLEETMLMKTGLPPEPRTGKKFHLFVSTHNAGALELVDEMRMALSERSVGRLRLLRSGSSSSSKRNSQGRVFSDLPRRITKRESNVSHNGFSTSLRDVLRRTGSAVRVSTVPAQLRDCEAMLVYLDRRTWDSGDASLAFGRHVALALARGMPLLLAHEMPSIDDDDRHGCQFALFFESDQTPQALVNAGIYHTVAVPLKGGEYRPTSIALLTRKLIEMSRIIHAKTPDLRTVTRALHDSLPMNLSDESLSGNNDPYSEDANHQSELPEPQRFPQPDDEAQLPTVDAIPTELTLSELVTVQSDDIIETNKDNEGMRESMTTSRAAVAVTDVRLEEKKQQPFEINKAQDNHDQDVEKGRPSEPLSVEADYVLSEDAISAQATMCIADAGAEPAAAAFYSV